MSRPVFHLAFPVKDLEESKAFYLKYFDAKVGRETETWIDIHFFGHQLTLHERPDETLPTDQQGVRHFGVILPLEVWEALAEKLKTLGCEFLMEPTVRFEGTPEEDRKILVADPSKNVVELKVQRKLFATN